MSLRKRNLTTRDGTHLSVRALLTLIASVLCVCAAVLCLPDTDKCSAKATEKATNPTQTIWSISKDCCFVSVCFCGRASPARHGPAGKATPDCLPVSISLRTFALLFIQCFISSYVIKSAFWVRLFPQPFFGGRARAGSLGETGRSVNTATNGVA
jgi:hypothetical protein